MDTRRALQTSAALLALALLCRGSSLGILLALGATVPAAIAVAQGASEETQRSFAYGVVLLLAGLVLAVVLLVLRLV